MKRWAFLVFFFGCGELFEALYPFFTFIAQDARPGGDGPK
jgi:hypothetical protein